MNSEIVVNISKKVVDVLSQKRAPQNSNGNKAIKNQLPEILFITSYPPKECGIATYSQDLFKALNNKFSKSFLIKICALESEEVIRDYPEEVKYTLDTRDTLNYLELAHSINENKGIELVLIQHEFGFFHQAGEDAFLQLLNGLTKPVVLVFHTVLPKPDDALKATICQITNACSSIVVMTQNAAHLLQSDYGIPQEKIIVIPHGTHLVPHLNKEKLKEKYGLSGKKVLSTFGFLSSGKSIETTLKALPAIIETNADVVFLVIGKTHPDIILSEGEKYRNELELQVKKLKLQHHVKFINNYLPLQDLLEYLQLTDIYLFTSKDPNQAVSGTFSYAMSCGCPIISTPIPHALEVLRENTGIIIDFQNSTQLANGVNRLMSNEALRAEFSSRILQQIVPTAWENAAIAHALLLQNIVGRINGSETPHSNGNSTPIHLSTLAPYRISLQYRMPEVNAEHVKKMTTDIGIIQFSIINQPDINSGYTLDDNARALIAMCMHYEFSGDKTDLDYIRIYLNFIDFCQRPEGYFLNYVDEYKQFTLQNNEVNLADSNGRAIWALGYLISKGSLLPKDLIDTATEILHRTLPRIEMMHSTRAMAFAIKGLYYCNLEKKSSDYHAIIKTLADRLTQMYRHEAEDNWQWYESYLTYANSVLPEAMLCAWLETGDLRYKTIAKESFDFLLTRTFTKNRIKVISNKSWLHKGQKGAQHGEQPIDVAYTILALNKFYNEFKEENYAYKMMTAFNWFLGNNHLNQIIYNPCTGGCYDGLEDTYVNLNQGSESTLSYLVARLTIDKHLNRNFGN